MQPAVGVLRRGLTVLTFLRFLVILAQLLFQLLRYLGGRLFYLVFFFLWRRAERRARIGRLRAVCFTAFFCNLKATFIKLGQILSARPDILSPPMIEELQTLQDRVPSFSFARVRKIIEADLGEPVEQLFAELSTTPVAAASIAQVHEGRLVSGERVAVKVQRPRIEKTMNRDLTIVWSLAWVVGLLPGIRNLRLPALAREFAKAIRAQLDFRLEVRNNRLFASNLRDLAHVRLPDIHAELCGDRVITMSFEDGRKLTDVVDDPPLPAQVLAERLLDVYYHMAFKDNFLHADLHPGNILVDDRGDFILLDTGLVYEIPPHYVRKFIRVCLAMVSVDGRLVGDAYLEGFEMSDKQREAAIEDMVRLEVKYKGRSYSELETGKIILDLLGVLRRHHIYLDAEWTGMALSDLTFEGIAKMLDKEIDLMAMTARKLPAYLPSQSFLDPNDPVLAALARRAMGEAAGKPGPASGDSTAEEGRPEG